jgi:histidinol phosphatase-like enzyme (inositol monophosphatase family)
MSEAASDLLAFALEIAREAGRATLERFGRPIVFERKADGSPVSEADRAAEGVLRRRIEERFPEDGILGEEMGLVRPGAGRRWVLDPIDGTKSFVRGVALYAVLVGLVEEGTPVLGVAHFPALGETVHAAAGRGAWWNGGPARVSALASLEESTLLVTDLRAVEAALGRERWERVRSRPALVRTWGDAYGHLLVATGRAEVMLDVKLRPWDALPLVPILREAGGGLYDWCGAPDPAEGHAVATCPGVRDELLELMSVGPGAE